MELAQSREQTTLQASQADLKEALEKLDVAREKIKREGACLRCLVINLSHNYSCYGSFNATGHPIACPMGA